MRKNELTLLIGICIVTSSVVAGGSDLDTSRKLLAGLCGMILGAAIAIATAWATRRSSQAWQDTLVLRVVRAVALGVWSLLVVGGVIEAFDGDIRLVLAVAAFALLYAATLVRRAYA